MSAFKEWQYYEVFIKIVLVSYGVILWYILKMYIEGMKNRKKQFFIVLINGLRLSAINSLDDVVNLYKSIFKPGAENPRIGLNSVLQQFLVKLLAKDLNQQIEDQEILEWKTIITEYIRKNEEVSPYFDLPDSERTLLNDMAAFLDKNDLAVVRRKMKELSVVIKTKQESFEKIQKSNKLSVPLAIVGLILTVFFGMASLR